MQEEVENIEPNGSPQLAELIRDNISYQNQQSIKRTLFKESMVKISIDKDYDHLFEINAEALKPIRNDSKKFVEVSEDLKKVCSWLEESEDFRGMAYLPFPSTPKLLHLLHQKVENTVIIITEYHSYWLEQMQEISRLSKIRWGFLNPNQQSEDKVKILELYEMKKTKLLFISPSLFRHEDYHEFECDLLVFSDLHLYQKSTDLLEHIISKCSPNRVLGLYSTPLRQAYSEIKFNMKYINAPEESKKSCICLKTTVNDKLKTMLMYIEKNDIKKALVIINNKAQAKQVAKNLKLRAMTSFNLMEVLTPQQIMSYNSCEVLKGPKNEEKVLDTIYKSQNFNITLSRHFDALRFADYDCLILYSFTDVPRFLEYLPDISHRLLLLAEDDYYTVRNSITSEHLTLSNLMKVVMRIMQKPRKVQMNTQKRYYSGYLEDRLLDCYSVCKEYVQRDEQKVIRVNWFCKNYEISGKVFNRVIEALDKIQIVENMCRVIYEIEVEEGSLGLLRKKFPNIIEVKKKVNVLNLSTAVQKTTRTILQELKQAGIQFKIVEEAVQIKVIKSYEDVDWDILQETVNENVWNSVKDLDRSYLIYKDCSYSSIQLTRREKYLQRKASLFNFHKQPDVNNKSTVSNSSALTNIFSSFHKSNLLTSEIEEWLRHSEENFKDEHDLVLILQGVDNVRSSKFREDAIFGRYRRFRYEDLLQVVTRIRKNKKVKIEQ